MEIINKITFDMAAAGMPPYIDAVQGDTLTRKVEATLMKRGQVFDLSDGFVSVSVAFKKPDGTAGWYDTMPDGSGAATVISDGVYQVSLAPEMFTAHGSVYALFRFDLDGKTISTFPFVVRVAENPSFNSTKSENYYNVQTWDAVNASFDEIFDKLDKLEQNVGSVEGAVLYTEQTLTPEQKAQARANIGAAKAGEGGGGGSSIEIDATLSVEGAAADANAVGNRFCDVEDSIGDIDTALDSIIAIQNTLIGGDS